MSRSRSARSPRRTPRSAPVSARSATVSPRSATRPRSAMTPASTSPALSLESILASALARVVLTAAGALAAEAGFTGRRRLINHLRGNRLPSPGAAAQSPPPGYALLESHRAGWVEDAVDRLTEAGYLSLAVAGGGAR